MTETFDAFYLREFRSMVALAAAVSGSHLLAEELAQEAMTRVYRRWDRIAGYDKLGAFARRVTINLAISRRRDRRSPHRLCAGFARSPAPRR